MSLFEECDALFAVRDRALGLANQIGQLTTDHAAKKAEAIDHITFAEHLANEVIRKLDDTLEAMLPGGVKSWREFLAPVEPED